MRSAIGRHVQREAAERRFVEQLADEFEIEDIDGLRDAIDRARAAYDAVADPESGEREAEKLDQLDAALWTALELLQDLQPAILEAVPGDDYGRIRRAYAELIDRLAEIGDIAGGVDRRRRGQGQHGAQLGEQAVDYRPLRALTGVLAFYWKGALKRKFSQRHDKQAWDGDRPLPKAKPAVLFCHAVIEHIAPGSGACLKTIAREYTGGSFTANKAAESRFRVKRGAFT